jgi:hypothetical protein
LLFSTTAAHDGQDRTSIGTPRPTAGADYRKKLRGSTEAVNTKETLSVCPAAKSC